MQTSFNQIQKFTNAAIQHLGKQGKEKTKFAYALERVLKQMQTVSQKFTTDLQEQLGYIALENCMTDPPNNPEGKVIKEGVACERCGHDNTRYAMSKVGEGKNKKEQKKAIEEATARVDITIEPYFATSIPEGLTDEQLEAFSGFVIKPEDVERLRAPETEETKLTAVA